MKQILIATLNPHKLREIKAVLKGPLHRKGISLVSSDRFRHLPKVKEDGRTYRANALKKAKEIARLTGLPVLAEDSGLEVGSLNRRPGIYSARYAGPKTNAKKNNRKLLKELANLSTSRRQARYCCVAAFVNPSKGRVITTQETCYGMIAEEPKGNKGFGYDPIFIPRPRQAGPAGKKTFGQLPAYLKNHISHRAKAFKKMLNYLLQEGKTI